MADWIDIRKDDRHVAAERRRAQSLKQTNWWKQQLQRGVCHYCGAAVGKAQLTMDHVVPVSRGGCSTKGNVVPACDACNKRKKYRTPAEIAMDELGL